METWFIILLVVIAVLAIALLLFFELAGDDQIRVARQKHNRGKYINDRTGVMYQTIRNTNDPEKAWHLFADYYVSNMREFLDYVPKTLKSVRASFFDHDVFAIEKGIREIADMRIELKDELKAEQDCLLTLDKDLAIDFSAWFYLGMNSAFTINDNMRRIAIASLRYRELLSVEITDFYVKQLNKVSANVYDVCQRSVELINAGMLHELREVRKIAGSYKTESYDAAQKLFDLIHDPSRQMDADKKRSLLYVLNALQEYHCLIATLRRLLLALIRLSMSK